MKRTILVRGARQLLTLRGPTGPRRGEAMRDLGVIEDGSLLIVNGVIESIGPTRRIENLSDSRSAEEISAVGHVVMPGFVDSHTQVVAPPARLSEYLMGAGAMRGRGSTYAREAFAAALHHIRSTPASTLEFHARKHLEAALRHGTTTMEAKSGFGLNASAELKMLRVLAALSNTCVSVVPTFLGAHALPPDFAGSPEDFIAALSAELVPRIASRRLAHFGDVLCDAQGFTPEQARPYLMAVRRAGLGVKLHGERSVRTGAVPLAVEMEATSIDGLNEVDGYDIDLLARSRTMATLLPGTVHQGAYARYAPGRDLIDAGAAVALATDFQPTQNSTFSMQMVISLACTHMGLTPEEAITAATINGAHALARSTRCGSLEFGKHADILIMNASDYRDIPYHFGGNAVALVMRRGEVVYREGSVNCSVA